MTAIRMGVAVAVAILTAGSILVAPRDARAAERADPDIVVIVTDDQGVGTTRWMPNVRSRLIARGTTFTHAVVPTTTCCPSRASILTGLLAQRSGVWDNGGIDDGTPIGGWPAFVAGGMEERTVATWLTSRYRTILVGKYLNNFDAAEAGYVPPGWDDWHTFIGRNGKYYDYRLAHTDGTVTVHGDRPADYSTDVLADLAVSAIRSAPKREPLLLFYTPYAPHGPSMPAPRHASESPSLRRYALPHVNEADVSDKPPWIASLHRVEIDRISRQRLSMYRSLQAVDEAVVDILAALKEARRLDDALIVFTSDNGVSSGEHRVPLNNKYLPYAAQSEVPLVLRWDGRIARGVIDRRLAVNVDIAATIADAAGQPPAGIDGRSLLSDRRRNGVVISAARSDGSGLNGIKVARPAYCGLRTRRYVYVLYSSGEEELYDYRRDPYELRNRSGAPAYADVRTSMRSRTLTRCTPRPPGW